MKWTNEPKKHDKHYRLVECLKKRAKTHQGACLIVKAILNNAKPEDYKNDD